MTFKFMKREVAVAAVAVLSTAALSVATESAFAQPKTPGKYVAGDFHNHSTCSDGSLSMQKKVQKSTGTGVNEWKLDWFVQAGHGGGGSRNCLLVEEPALATPAYPFTNQGPTTTWANSIGSAALKGLNGGVGGNGNMWRWQALQEFQYPLMEYLAANKNVPMFLGLESVVAGHEHSSMAIITGQMPVGIDTVNTNVTSYTPLGNANALAQWEYCFDRADGDTSRGNSTVGSAFVPGGNNWNCSVTGSANSSDASWSALAQKLIPAGGVGTGNRGHLKTLEALRWMAENHPTTSYYIPAHLERAGPFNPNGNNGFNVEHLRNFNNVAPNIAFGMETPPGHGASSERGEYRQLRNGGFPPPQVGNVDSVGGTTYGGTGVYGAQIGGVWDALLGEGRNFWFFASSDWHNRGMFGADDRRTTLDFEPGEYQKNYTLVRNGSDKLRPQTIVDGLRTGNNWVDSGQLIDRLAFVVCSGQTAAAVQALAVTAANNASAVDNVPGCANMGEKLVVAPGTTLIVGVAVRDPGGLNNSPYSFNNPSLTQISIAEPMNRPVLKNFDLIGGAVTGLIAPGSPNYAGEWPRNGAWLDPATGLTAGLSAVPAAAKNTSTALLSTFNSSNWSVVSTAADGTRVIAATFPLVASNSRYVRLRGSNLPASTPWETDASGNPLADAYTNAVSTALLRIPCTVTGSNVPAMSSRRPYTGNNIDGCPGHLPVVSGVRYSAFDVAAWADLSFYSNPIYVQVTGSSVVASVIPDASAAPAPSSRRGTGRFISTNSSTNNSTDNSTNSSTKTVVASSAVKPRQ